MSSPRIARRLGALVLGSLLPLTFVACMSRTDNPPDAPPAVADAPTTAAAGAPPSLLPPPLVPAPLVPAPSPAYAPYAVAPQVALDRAERSAYEARFDAAKGAAQASAPAAAMGYPPSGAMYQAPLYPVAPVVDTERYAHHDDNPVHLAATDPVSTFSIDVDTASYANLRRILNEGRLPPEDAVRTEELINYFGYDDPAPASAATPFAVTTELAAAPWDAERLLLRIGIKGYAVPPQARPAANLVFLIDVSGSMQDPAKLALLKPALGLLARQLEHRDRISLVVYAGASGIVLPPTPGDRRAEIDAAIDSLEAGGSTNGGEGIRLAYQVAHQAYIKGGINRVLLATDGDFNVGTVSTEALVDIVARERQRGVALTTLGFGAGNYDDELMEQLADKGDGNYAYIDSLLEAQKVLVEQVAGTLQTIAGDVKAQVEFNPALVAEYRLIGYEDRLLRREDFNDDAVDAGDIGSGHSVTALYEIALVGSRHPAVDPLRYAAGTDRAPAKASGKADELAYLKLRFKRPGQGASELIERRVLASQKAATPSADFRFAAAVAAYGQKLRGGAQLNAMAWAAIAELARGARAADPRGERSEFLRLVALTETLAGQGTPERTAAVD